MNKCPKCGHEYPAKNQAKGGKNRWKGLTKKQRSEEMKRVRAKGISSANASDHRCLPYGAAGAQEEVSK
jgi:DNA-directed RNA polymerase subunit M/transcription elongation factor TFIIS